MNARKNSIQIYAMLSLALMIALMGWKTLRTMAADGEPIAPNPVDVNTHEDRQDTNGLEPDGEAQVIIEPLESDPEPTPYPSDDDAILAALAKHFRMDENDFYHFEVKENTGTHARGGVDNGYFLAAKVEGQWVFVAGGHSVPNCNDVIEYGFPAYMVPECPAVDNTPPVCQGSNAATFIKDVTIADGSIMESGQLFTKTWRIQNAGTCTWNSAYQLVFVSGDLLGGPLPQPLTYAHVLPGGTIDVSVLLKAPEESGSYRGYWRFRDSNGESFGLTSGGSIWVDIQVQGESSGQDSSSEDYSGYPFIEILDVSKNQTVTIKGKNFPAWDSFNVLMNYYGTKGENGQVVTSIQTGEGGEFTETYQIPAFLQGQTTIAIRLESPYSGYYAYNWFSNY